MTTQTGRPLPLEDIVVVSVEQAVAAPFASRQLADLGARVIKVERPDGGDFARGYDTSVNGLSSYFAWLNRGKESITADLKAAEDRDTVEALVSEADVFIQNLAPGAAQRLGLDADSLVRRFPRLVACDVSGYGAGGPYEHRKAYDLLIQCEAGLVSITGAPEAPAKVGVSIADIAAGMYTFTGALTALYERERTGSGTALKVSLFDALAEWMSSATLYGHYGGGDPARTGASHASIAPYGPFAARGGTEINIGVQNQREWAALCTAVLHRADLLEDRRFASNPSRVAHRAELDRLIGEAVGELDAEELIARLQAAGIAFGAMRTARGLVDHPQMMARDRWCTVGSPVGPVAALKPPVVVNGREPAMGPIPALGEHDASVRAWLERARS